jgi:YcaO-like protein with predicted kinase domain
VKLKSCIKVAHGRCAHPEETVQRLESIFRSRYDYWLHEEAVAAHLYWTAMFLEEEPEFRSMGKGESALWSKAGALAEGAEWLTCREFDRLPGYVTAYEEDAGDCLSIATLVSHVAIATPPVIDRIRELDAARHWVDGTSLESERVVKVPLEYVRQISGPNGRASGNRLEEAIVHATHEIFERRAHITVLRGRMIMPTIDAGTIEHPVLQEQVGFFLNTGIEVTLKDLSFGGELPCVGAYFYDPNVPDNFQFHHFFKVGSSFNREEALLRVFTEYAQGRMRDEFIRASEGDAGRILRHDFRRLQSQGHDCDNFLSAFTYGFVPYRTAAFLTEGEVVPFAPGDGYEDCLDDIAHARSICEALGKEYVVVDLTDPDIGFPVVQVVIPGYSDVLPFHPASSRVLFRPWTRDEVLHSYTHVEPSA